MISRRMFIGGVVTTAAGAEPMLKTFVHDLDLEVERAVQLQEGDVLIVRVPEHFSPADVAKIGEVVQREVWPKVIVVPVGVELEVLSSCRLTWADG